MKTTPQGFDPVATALFAQRLAAVAEEMGVCLQRAAFSPNVKERRDYSCAIFLGDGTLVAQAAHIPVHLGSASLSVRAAIAALELAPGDEVVLNDPYAGGTHLPDVTVLMPLWLDGRRGTPDLFVGNRAHHADIGGATPGSMGLARDVHAEGFRIPPVHLAAQVRGADERLGDLAAQRAANAVGASRLREIARASSPRELLEGAAALPRATARAMRERLAEFRRGRFSFEDALEGDGFGSGELRIALALEIAKGRAPRFDFTGSAKQCRGPLNANLAILRSCVGYVLRCLLPPGVPQNDGVLDAVSIVAEEGSIVNAIAPAAVAAGNVETSQRIVDVVLGALGAAYPPARVAASCGTMTNVSFGNEAFTYYETVAGGAGASRRRRGASVVQTHMTNTLNTPIEVIESGLPLRVDRCAVRRGSGGSGARKGGDGMVRCYRALAPMTVAVLAERQQRAPYGREGGGDGACGRTSLRRGASRTRLPAKFTSELRTGDVVEIETPGGGGHGTPRRGSR
jgi:N-methylhydantoinase B